jgi:hypothetical protein
MAWVEKRGDLFRVRFRLPDGTVATDSSYPTKTAAKARAADVGTDQRRDVFISPEDGKITIREWVEVWSGVHDVGKATLGPSTAHISTSTSCRGSATLRSPRSAGWPSKDGSATSAVDVPRPLSATFSACCRWCSAKPSRSGASL